MFGAAAKWTMASNPKLNCTKLDSTSIFHLPMKMCDILDVLEAMRELKVS